MKRTPKKHFKFKPNVLMRYTDNPLDQTTFLFGPRKDSAKLQTSLIKIAWARDAIRVIPEHRRDFQVHRIKTMEMRTNQDDPTDFILMEYIDSFSIYGLITADKLVNNTLWSDEDESRWNRIVENDGINLSHYPTAHSV